MPKPFYERLYKYFKAVSEVLKGEAEPASIFPNTTDIGLSRESIYIKFLTQHLPSKCNCFLGGFLFGESGEESKQLDVIIMNDAAPRYNFYNQDDKGKSFGPVEGCLGVASIKSMLDKAQLVDSLSNIASIPATSPLDKKVNPMLNLKNYEDWPYKIVYASNGLAAETIIGHLNEYYSLNPGVPIFRRPDIIHVAGKYVIFRIKENMTLQVQNEMPPITEIGEYKAINADPDVQAFVWLIDELQRKATAANHILFRYGEIVNAITANIQI